MRKIYLFSILVFLAIGTNAQTTVVLTADRDNTIFSHSTSRSNGAGQYFFVGKNAGSNNNSVQRGLVYFNLATKTKFGELMGSYWTGTKYISPIGGDLYQGASRRWDALNQYPEPKRKILILRLMNNIKLTENAQIISRFEPYYDFGARAWNWSSSLFLSVKI